MAQLSTINKQRQDAGVQETNVRYNSRTAQANANIQEADANNRNLDEQEQIIQQQRSDLLAQHQAGTISNEEYNRRNTYLTNSAMRVSAARQNNDVSGDRAHMAEATATYDAAAEREATANRQPSGAIEQSAYTRIKQQNPEWTEAQIYQQIDSQQPGIQSTMSNSGKGMNYDSKGVAIPGSEGAMFRNNPGAQTAANRNAADEAAISGIIGYKSVPIYNEDGQITGYRKVQDEAETERLRAEARAAAKNKAAADANYAASRNATMGDNMTPGSSGAANPTDTATDMPESEGADDYVPNPDSFLAGLDALEQQYAGTTMAPLFEFYRGQYSMLQAKGLRGEQLLSEIQKKTDAYVARQQADMSAMSTAWTAMYDKIKDSQLESAQRTYDQQQRLAEQQKQKDQLEYERAIRDQNIRNEEDRQSLLLNNGISGGWRSSMHTSRMIDAFKKADNIIADLQNDKIMNSQAWDNKIIDIEQNYHSNITAAYDAHNMNLLTLQDKLAARAAEIDKTIYNNDVNQLNATNSLLNDWFDGVAAIAEGTTNAVITAEREAIQAAERAKSELRQAETAIWNDALKVAAMDGDGKQLLWDALVKRAEASGVTIPGKAPSIANATEAARNRTQTAMTSIIGKPEYQHNGVDYGYLLSRSIPAKGYSNDDAINAIETERMNLDMGRWDVVGERILNNVRDGMGETAKNKVIGQNDIIRELQIAQGFLNKQNPQFGGLWKQLIETGKTFGEFKKDKDFEALKAHIENVIGMERHERFGSTLTEGENYNANNFLPDFNKDTAQSIQTKINAFLGVAQRSRANKYDMVLGTGMYEKVTGEKIPTGTESIGGAPQSTGGTSNNALYDRWGITPPTKPKGGQESQWMSMAPVKGSIGEFFSSMGKVTQGFSTTIASRANGGLYDESTVKAWGGKHAGLDVAIPSGTEIQLPFDGEVIEADFTPGWGGTIVVKDSKGAEHRFSHMMEIPIQKGAKLLAGTVIGKSGGGKNDYGRGNSTGSHLDYRIRYNGQYVDPLSYTV